MLMGFGKANISYPFITAPYPLVSSVSIKTQLIKLLLFLLFILTFHTAAMIYFEHLPLGDAIWLTMTSATTVGYGDFSAHTTAGRFATVFLLYIGGIATLAQAATLYFEYRQEVMNHMLRGDWSWKMNNHLVFIGCPEDVGEEYYYKAISGLRKSSAPLGKLPIIIVSKKLTNGISDKLRKLDVVHVSKSIADPQTLEATSIHKANTVIILAKDKIDPLSDSLNFELIDRLREEGVTARIIVEAVKDENRIRLKKVGANSVLRPIRTYPELLMRSILAHGSEQVIETLFDSFGNECIRYDIEIEDQWLNIIHKLATEDAGLPISYENNEGNIINNPSSKKQIHAKAIFVIEKEGQVRTDEEIKKILKAAA